MVDSVPSYERNRKYRFDYSLRVLKSIWKTISGFDVKFIKEIKTLNWRYLRTSVEFYYKINTRAMIDGYTHVRSMIGRVSPEYLYLYYTWKSANIIRCTKMCSLIIPVSLTSQARLVQFGSLKNIYLFVNCIIASTENSILYKHWPGEDFAIHKLQI